MKATLSVFFICSVYFLAAQSDGPDSTSRSYNTEIGLNITNTLAGFSLFGEHQIRAADKCFAAGVQLKNDQHHGRRATT
jgi:hypothetical protein